MFCNKTDYLYTYLWSWFRVYVNFEITWVCTWRDCFHRTPVESSRIEPYRGQQDTAEASIQLHSCQYDYHTNFFSILNEIFHPVINRLGKARIYLRKVWDLNGGSSEGFSVRSQWKLSVYVVSKSYKHNEESIPLFVFQFFYLILFC